MAKRKFDFGILAGALVFVLVFSGCGNTAHASTNQIVGVWALRGIDESGLPGSASNPVMDRVALLYSTST